MIDARSSVGPITFGAVGVTGVDRSNGDAAKCLRHPTRQRTSRSMSHQLRSGNRLYDAELLRRIDARRHPTVTLDLQAIARRWARPGGTSSRRGHLSWRQPATRRHGVGDHAVGPHMVVRGEQVIDIRDFGVVSPDRADVEDLPDVTVALQVEAEFEAQVQGVDRQQS